MEDPVRDITTVLKKLVKRPTFQSLANTMRENFTEDCEFYHPYINVGSAMGLRLYSLIFQFALLTVNYQDVLVRDIVYDQKKNIAVVRMTVRTNPWILLWRTVNLQLLTELQLRDTKDEKTGRVLKKIKVQRDYFIRSPLVQAVPILGDIYDSDKLRYIGGEATGAVVRFVQEAYHTLVPAKLRQAVFQFWREFLQIPLFEQSGVSIHKAMD
ncbi:hypothetical protein R1flu_004348 [Riccia fluitans]|uniref:SigF-like NTF2-like domain-containing protein n=1 Tax=Riccia fluitans TaxID=41844 RepID=A0ABD1YQ13_9MARC